MSATPSSPEARLIREGLALSLVPDIGCSAFRERVERYGSAADALLATIPLAERWTALHAADEILACARRTGVRVILLGEPEYPEPLSSPRPIARSEVPTIAPPILPQAM